MGNCESRNAGTRNGMWNGSKIQRAPEISAKYAMMNVHAHIVKAHMVIGATVKSAGSGATAKSVRQSVSLGR